MTEPFVVEDFFLTRKSQQASHVVLMLKSLPSELYKIGNCFIIGQARGAWACKDWCQRLCKNLYRCMVQGCGRTLALLFIQLADKVQRELECQELVCRETAKRTGA
jgi:hypothetical protein